MTRTLAELTAPLDPLEKTGPADPRIAGLAYDSRDVREGWLFFALTGIHADGHRFIDAAIERGATAIVHETPLETYRDGVAYVRVADSRAAMAPVAAAFHGRPSANLACIGVTGTEGKSTTVFLTYQLLDLAGFGAGFFSTVMSRTSGGETPNPEHQTTPEATAVQRMLAEIRDSGKRYAVLESSSHGLSPRTGRLAEVAFDVGVMMNVTHEHLEFHGTWEQYRADKANLFRALDRAEGRKSIGGQTVELPVFGVANADDPSFDYFKAATGKPVYGFSASGRPADLSATDIESDAGGASFLVSESGGPGKPARIELPGAFNVANTLAALLVATRLTGRPLDAFLPLLPRLRPVLGRMTPIDEGQPFEVLVDYAHTPSSFEVIFPPLRKRLGDRKIIALFGSGGERDTAKRPRQGRIAADWCDIVVLADEDPRGEDPMALLEDIAAGCPELRRGERLFLIPERGKAIRKAFALAGPGDLVLLLAKGHENSIIYADGPHSYDEFAEARSALAELGFRGKREEE
ncbi:MAG: UDP-N-acetylmuramoyl-L-alanyl-D-glutamate--2,6-diaminopimelate ligase [Spirochaetales bacterium]|nr:UDP-N-acetylmuramoyl-L-alanyl-D-glutamate--2,6-diaminopimelate ligase [Spirochaetales bacterium]